MPYINQSPNQLGTFPTSGDAANWSLYEATSDIDVNCRKLIDAKAIEFCGTTNTLKNDNGDTAVKTTNENVADKTFFPVEKLLKQRTYKRRKEKLVKFLGYKEPRWMPAESVTDMR